MNARREWLDAALGRYVLANPQQAADTVTVVQFMRWLSTERVQCPAKARNGLLCDREEGHSGLHEWTIVNVVLCDHRAPRSGSYCTQTRGHAGAHTWGNPCICSRPFGSEHENGCPAAKPVNRVRDYFDKRPEIRVAGLTGARRNCRCGVPSKPSDTGHCVHCGVLVEVPDPTTICASTRGLACDCPGTVCRAGSR